MSRSERLLALLQSLRTRRQPTSAATLAAEFGISERTIYRDISSLVGQGAAIEGAPGLGYVLRPGFFLPPLMFDDVEASAVLLGLRFVMRRGDPALTTAARRAASKIAAILPETVERRVRINGLVVAPSEGSASHPLSEVRDAIESERKLRIRYLDAAGAVTERTIWPIALGFFDSAEVLAAWCELRGDFRHFRLDRISTFSLLDDRVPTPRRLLLAEWGKIESGVEL
ncbi:YafY family protein [Devosia sp. UYZn731]|uniref:helix-turn-helix transcriptional regulator n=1 Tax=Devosia sp. UYZn731 TaxID=3156345 RepID=UPI003393D1E0